ncbi:MULTISPECIES: ABC-ATPase domain-containing protein [Lachnospiraceae]|uniref:ABC-ATPase domain-containing protein n=1 Tax=Faecalicatena acetigenes TaxID=2981790 RepID=A0ABT2T9W9_9FIRM|nr:MULTISPECIES: ABC-ATPase domain-containing protein [Lachnospiraceae]MCU6747077.1 ABC-ATPase domain-containing protein [Faecalicatena acetigenes]SCH61802.1 Predicted ATPase of the ABC class [uncultured Clostridium sp.]
MQTAADLRNLLNKIDHRGYPAYKDTKGIYQFPGYVLSIDHVQGDPFASPSKVSVFVKGRTAAFPKALYEKDWQRIALQDELIRQFGRQVGQFAFKAKGSGKSGLISVSRPGQEILERTCCQIDGTAGDVTVRMEIGFPANGRTINARELIKILFEFLPVCVEKALYYKNLRKDRLKEIADLAEDQRYIREQLDKRGLIAFIANGSILPRESGVSDRPMKNGIAFRSPKELEVSFDLPHKGTIIGMGIKKGITLIVGGGYHGKSTLLKALELGVYDHIAGDGREYVITDSTAVKIRAEDGRSIEKTDISMFINDLPNGKDTVGFCTEDASGSTSQAANVVEAMEAGSRLLLIDEDTSATNFMIRDELMQRVIHRDMEPITPFIERIRELYSEYGISTIIVAGSSGAYFHIADSIVQMERYIPKDITQRAKKEAEQFPVLSVPEEKAKVPVFSRCPKANTAWKGQERIKMKTLGKEAVQINRESIDLRYVEQITDSEQVTALGYCMRYAQKYLFDGKRTMREVVAELEKKIQKDALAGLCGNSSSITGMAMPRAQEIFACFNRYRGLKV